MFLDIVIIDTKVFVLDEKELEKAKFKKIVTDEEYELAIRVKNKLLLYLSDKNNIEKFKEYIYKEIRNIIGDRNV